jgi:hypothetical protein
VVITFVTLAIALDLLVPERGVGRRLFEQVAIVAMPKTAMHENNGAVLGKRKVRPAGKFRIVQAIPESEHEQRMPDCYFDSCIFSTNPGHHAAPGSRINNVCQGTLGRLADNLKRPHCTRR